MRLPFLLEVGTEEIPDWMIERGLAQLKESVEGILLQAGLYYGSAHGEATPRRMVVRIDDVEDRKDDRVDLMKGPPVAAGQLAAEGFLKKQGGSTEDLCADAEGKYYMYRKRIPGRQTVEILSGELPKAILQIHWPKAMYWNRKGSERFIRPIRWVLGLFGDSVLEFAVAGVKAGNITQGHRLLGRPAIPVNIDNFEEQLLANGVILPTVARRKKIETETALLLEGRDLQVRPDPALLETLIYITEFPTPILGSFDRQYLELPQEVLVTVMRHHQKYFSVEDAQGNVAPYFIAVMNTNGDPEGLVRHGNERVLRARFNDARFFWQVDQEKKLEERLPDLANVTFHAKLGSYWEKTVRVEKLANQIAEKFQTVFPDAVQQAAQLCKCDLTTDMVKEFPELQGVVGGLYAAAQGKNRETWLAIYDHYMPVGAADCIPRTPEGRIVSLADKLDTLRECFRIGLVPTGSKDPLALRRAAQGVIRICIEGKLDLWPDDLIDGNQQLWEFLLDRIRHYFRDVRGFAYDEVNAVLSGQMRDLHDIEHRLSAVRDVRSTENFEPIAASFKRIRNILQQASFTASELPKQDLLELGPERDLYDAYKPLQAQVYLFADQKQYMKALEAIASLRPRVDLFFDKVLVNAPDEAVRRNRLSLLHNLLTEFSTIADFSEIVTNERQETRN